MFSFNEIDIDDGNLITNIRHKDLIKKAILSVKEAKNGVEMNNPIDLVAISLKQALEELSSIVGKNASEDIISEIFSKFCLGK